MPMNYTSNVNPTSPQTGGDNAPAGPSYFGGQVTPATTTGAQTTSNTGVNSGNAGSTAFGGAINTTPTPTSPAGTVAGANVSPTTNATYQPNIQFQNQARQNWMDSPTYNPNGANTWAIQNGQTGDLNQAFGGALNPGATPPSTPPNTGSTTPTTGPGSTAWNAQAAADYAKQAANPAYAGLLSNPNLQTMANGQQVLNMTTGLAGGGTGANNANAGNLAIPTIQSAIRQGMIPNGWNGIFLNTESGIAPSSGTGAPVQPPGIPPPPPPPGPPPIPAPPPPGPPAGTPPLPPGLGGNVPGGMTPAQLAQWQLANQYQQQQEDYNNATQGSFG